ncbi:AraC family transcriptional regulator [Actinomadura sp. J1-007]|nr:AraC family transcriptional regulator [Actinomadura sp. J1-007]
MNSIERTIEAMQRNLSEQITVDDMARVAMFSKFYFTRIFRDSTGLSPGKFLSALRLQEAKRLLTATSLSIAEISNRVGYSSVGTFSSRFKTNVGVAPTVYRATGGLTPEPGGDREGAAPSGTATVLGDVSAPGGRQAPVFIGLFPEPMPRGTPASCTVRHGQGPFTLTDVPQGTWHLLVYSPPLQPDAARGRSEEERGPSIGSTGPIDIRADTRRVTSADVRLRPITPFDPPLLPMPFGPPVVVAPRGPAMSGRRSAGPRHPAERPVPAGRSGRPAPAARGGLSGGAHRA